MICFVSGENETIGCILNANVTMKEFFSISQEKILLRSQKIEQIIPNVLVEKHS
jgi:hypothetical protein